MVPERYFPFFPSSYPLHFNNVKQLYISTNISYFIQPLKFWVIGLRDLRVADASVVPTIPTGNPATYATYGHWKLRGTNNLSVISGQ
ncbi:hypothetical protein EG68_09670 [Paragonimus skrjabini miyazakii]|uniref:Glucose-methanol-choline oxidoreductase C-terminal domain-containing protein n=1 Tax=Paragonimus skrjabini miyazakii TaxID=59628 RepID=A0A8S9YGC4_9TREM|nr:hypothetical protein EG68_09670 [Paragonimus skrjabini miyazakii]